MFRNGLVTELRWFIIILIVVAIFGHHFDILSESIIVYLLAYIAWIYLQTAQLKSWLVSYRHSGQQVNTFSGIWGDIADEVARINKLYTKDKTRLSAIVHRIQEMTSAIEDGVILIDKRANIEWWNENAQYLFNLHDLDKGHRLENIIRHPSFVQYFENQDYSEPLEIEGLLREQQHLEFRVHLFGQGNRLVIIREITRMKKLLQMRKDFVANVSHELRTPLTVIRGYLETLADMPNVPAPMQKALLQMQQQGQRMTNLINDLISLSRIETESIDDSTECVKLSNLIDVILSEAKNLTENNHHTLKRTGVNNISILGNSSQLHSAISNLVFNAIKYSPKGSIVEVNARLFGNECIVSVEDNGNGIDSKHLPRLTERFYRVDDGRATSMGGTGLGLSVVKHVLFRHEAELKIRSQLGKGSTFSCHFPLKRVQTEEAQEDTAESA